MSSEQSGHASQQLLNARCSVLEVQGRRETGRVHATGPRRSLRMKGLAGKHLLENLRQKVQALQAGNLQLESLKC